jgi:hypothetical protein
MLRVYQRRQGSMLGSALAIQQDGAPILAQAAQHRRLFTPTGTTSPPPLTL